MGCNVNYVMGCNVNSFLVLDPCINFSDHVPLVMNLCVSDVDKGDDSSKVQAVSSLTRAGIKQIVHLTSTLALNWNHSLVQ